MTLPGIDVSHYDPDLDYQRAHAEGAAFIVHKASEGGSTDPAYVRRAPAIRSSGAVPGAYHFLRSGPSAAEQVGHFLSVVGDPTGLLIQLDWEPSGSDLASITMARSWVAEWNRRTNNHPVLIYLPHQVWLDHLGSPPGLSTLGPLWASHYLPGQALSLADATRIPTTWWAGYGGWSRPKILQYAGEAGRIAGNGPADLNVFDGIPGDLATLARTPLPPDVQQEDDMPSPFPLTLPVKPGDIVDYSIPPVQAGAAGWGPAWLTVSGDPTRHGPAAFRVAVGDGAEHWMVLGEAITINTAHPTWNVQLGKNVRAVSIERVPASPDDNGYPMYACVEYAPR